MKHSKLEHLIYLAACLPGLISLGVLFAQAPDLDRNMKLGISAVIGFLILLCIKRFSAFPSPYLQKQATGKPVQGQDLAWEILVIEDPQNQARELQPLQAVSNLWKPQPDRPQLLSGADYLNFFHEKAGTHTNALDILVERELLTLQKHSKARAFFCLVFPFLVLANFVAAFYLYHLQIFGPYNDAFGRLGMPSFCMICSVLIIKLWARFSQRMDKQLDACLCRTYSPKDVIAALYLNDQWERSGEKDDARSINDRDFAERKEAIKKLMINE